MIVSAPPSPTLLSAAWPTPSPTPVVVAAEATSFPIPTTFHSDDDKEAKLDISGLKVLVGDDEDLARFALIELLSEYLFLGRHNFLEAVSLQSAMEVFERQQKNIRAVLTDIDMPAPYAGIRLYHELRSHFGFTGPIALMSARPEHDPQIAAVIDNDLEACFFSKPIVAIEPIGDWLRRGWS